MPPSLSRPSGTRKRIMCRSQRLTGKSRPWTRSRCAIPLSLPQLQTNAHPTHPVQQSQNPLILCVIDGDANIFSPALLAQGQYGGQQAAQQLTKGIAEYLSQEDVQVFGRLSFWITVYLNRRTLLETLLGNSLCTTEQFEAFLIGFSLASPRFQLVEVGSAQEAVDAKIKGVCRRH